MPHCWKSYVAVHLTFCFLAAAVIFTTPACNIAGNHNYVLAHLAFCFLAAAVTFTTPAGGDAAASSPPAENDAVGTTVETVSRPGPRITMPP